MINKYQLLLRVDLSYQETSLNIASISAYSELFSVLIDSQNNMQHRTIVDFKYQYHGWCTYKFCFLNIAQ